MKKNEKALYELKANVIAALAQPIRLAIVDYLAAGEKCVCQIASHVCAERSNVSRHLAVLVHAGLLDSRKEGLKVFYTLRTPCILGFLDCVADVLRRREKTARDVLATL
jgi:DNA-binding transcriptional ArsR family regulator